MAIRKGENMKKIGFISDLHIDSSPKYQPEDFLSTLAHLIHDRYIDTLIIGGDISNHHSTTTRFVERLQQITGVPIYFIPGNHDYWEMEEAVKHTKQVHEIFKRHPQSLMNAPLVLNEQYGIVGSPGWYNHTYHDPRFSKEELEIGKYRMATWQDKVHSKWPVNDGELSKYFSDEARKHIVQVNRPKIILVTHVITIPEFTIPMPNKIFDFFNAYIATNDFDDIYQEFSIDYSVMGHVHYRGEIQRDGTKFITNSLGYQKQWRTKELYRELTDSLWVFKP